MIFINFTQMFLSRRRCAESLTQLRRLNAEVTLQSWDLLLNFVSFKSPQPFVRFSLNITQMILSVSWCAEPMTQLCKLKVKVTLQGHGILRQGIMAVKQTAVLYLVYSFKTFFKFLHLYFILYKYRTYCSIHVFIISQNNKIQSCLLLSLSFHYI